MSTKFKRTAQALERYDRFRAVWDRLFDRMSGTPRFRILVRRERFFAWQTVGLAFTADTSDVNRESHVRACFAGFMSHHPDNEFKFGFDDFIRKCVREDKS